MKKFKFTLIFLLFSLTIFSFIDAKNKDNKTEIITPTSNNGTTVVGTNIGNKAPELKFKSPDGKIIALSSLKGKLVLVDFWASWCPPCRRENPNVVEVYNEFKNKNFKQGKEFTVYSVSLDKNKSSWIKAIKDDNLQWDNQVSDLNGWSSEPARIYGIRAIPSNFLINDKGIIIAKNLRGQQLYNILNKLVQN